MKYLPPIAGAAALLAAGLALANPRELSSNASDFLASWEPSGATTECVMIRQIDSIKALAEDLLLVEMNNGTYYLNRTNGRCTGATHKNRRFEYSTSTPRLCGGEILRVVDNSFGTFMGSCSLGSDFEELQRKAETPA
jgi:hypothetical protein